MKKRDLQVRLHQIQSNCFVALSEVQEGTKAAECIEQAYMMAERCYNLVHAAPCLWNQEVPFEMEEGNNHD